MLSELKFGAPGTHKNRIPFRLMYDQGDVHCQWLHTGTFRYCDPFFDETIGRYKSLPENSGSRLVTDAVKIGEWSGDIDSIYPTAIIFHVSRCGSTLISQALGSIPQNVSVSEVPVFDEILRLQLKGCAIDDAELERMLAGAVKFYGARKNKEEHRFFIKTDCWHLLFHDRFRKLYPDVPFIIIYRHPSEVLESNRRHKGMQSVYGLVEPALYGFDNSIPDTLIHPDNYIAAVLEQLYSAIISIVARDNNVLLLNYSEGFDTMMDKLLRFAGITLSSGELAAIEARGRFDAKSPSVKFVEQNTGNSAHDHAPLLELYERIIRGFPPRI